MYSYERGSNLNVNVCAVTCNAEFDYLFSAGKETDFPTEVNHAGVGVIVGQKHPVAGVHLSNSHGLLHVLLEKEGEGRKINLALQLVKLFFFWFSVG